MLCNIKNCNNVLKSTYKKCLIHRRANMHAQRKRRGGLRFKEISTEIENHKNLSLSIRAKLSSYKCSDVQKKRDCTNYITVQDVLKLKKDSCIFCNCILLYKNYTKFNPQQYSIDRLDSELGHVRENCQIICLHCNISKSRKTNAEYYEYMNE
jgi:hypothetical protein